MTTHRYWLNAGARNIRATTASASSRFMRKMPRVTDNVDLFVCGVIVALVVAYGTW